LLPRSGVFANRRNEEHNLYAPKIAGENFRSLLIVAGEDATPRQLLFAYRVWLLKVPLPRSGVLANRDSEDHNLYFRT
jgi:hypothetical protein